MTTTDTTTPTDRTLYGCPSWCAFDHAGEILMEPGDHMRDLAKLSADEFGDSVGLYVAPTQPIHVMVFLGRNGSEEYPATRETVEELRDVAVMFRQAADELSGLPLSGELETRA
jgi:hypothetical protein